MAPLNDNVFLHVVSMCDRARRTALGYSPARCKALGLAPTWVRDINPARLHAVMRAKQHAWETRESFTDDGIDGDGAAITSTRTRIFDAPNKLYTSIHCFVTHYCSTLTITTTTNFEVTPPCGNGSDTLLSIRPKGGQSTAGIVVYSFYDNRVIEQCKWRDDHHIGNFTVQVDLIVQ